MAKETPKEPKRNRTSKTKTLKEAVSSVVSSEKQEDKTDSTQELLSYLKENFPFITTIISEMSKNAETSDKDMLSKLGELEKHAVKNKNQNAQIQTKLENSRKLLSAIDEKLKHANDQRKQSADLEEERIAEEKKEKAILEEKRAEAQERQNAEIITKLSDLGESFNNLEISGGKSGGGGLGGLLKNIMGLLPNLLTSLLPMVMTGLSAIGGAIATLFSTLLPVILPLAVAALAAGAGYMLFKTVIEPWMDEKQKAVQDSLKSVLSDAQFSSEQITTDTGEKVFTREDTKTGKISYVTEGQMKSELASMSEEDRAKIESGEGPVSYSAAQNTIDLQSGMYANLDPIQSGKSIEQINQIAEDAEKGRAALPENLKAQAQYAKEISNFDESFRNQLANTMTAWAKEGGVSTSLLGSRETFKVVLEKLYNEHMSLINRIRLDKRLKPEDTAQLMKMSPLFDGAFTIGENEGQDPDFDTVWVLGYDLPNGQGLTFDWGNSMESLAENRALIDAEFGSPSGRAESLKKKYDAKAALEKNKQAVQPTESQQPTLETPPQAAEGAVVYPKTGKGVLTNISEDMKPEAVVPLDKYVISEKDTTGVEAVNMSEKATTVMRNTYFEEKDAQQETQAPLIINNVTNTKGTSGGGDGVSFQYQTDLARTFDTVFEMILEKNMRMGIV
jgi:hypothetical protein